MTVTYMIKHKSPTGFTTKTPVEFYEDEQETLQKATRTLQTKLKNNELAPGEYSIVMEVTQ